MIGRFTIVVAVCCGLMAAVSSAPAFAQDKCVGICAKRCAKYSGTGVQQCQARCEAACRSRR